MALQRLLLLIPTTTYRTRGFQSRRPRTPRRGSRDRLRPPERDGGRVPGTISSPLPFGDPAAAAREIHGYAARRPLDAVGAGGRRQPTVVASAIGEALGLRVKPRSPRPQATRNKLVMARAGSRARGECPHRRSPRSRWTKIHGRRRRAHDVSLRAQSRSCSRPAAGVIRADDAVQFAAAFRAHPRDLADGGRGGAGRGDRHHPRRGLSCRAARWRSKGLLEDGALRTPGSLRQAPIRSTAPSSRRPSTWTPSRLPEATRARVAETTAAAAPRPRPLGRRGALRAAAAPRPRAGSSRWCWRSRPRLDRRPLRPHAALRHRPCRSRS